MASSRDSAYIENLTKCCICLGVLTQPKCLPCIHTFCLKCLREYGKDQRPGDELPCPLCRQTFSIPAEGFRKLPTNFFIDQILASRQLFGTGSSVSGVKCESCDDVNANGYCVECANSMCDRCLVTHGNLTATQSHKV